jgi:hypothetical protein
MQPFPNHTQQAASSYVPTDEAVVIRPLEQYGPQKTLENLPVHDVMKHNQIHFQLYWDFWDCFHLIEILKQALETSLLAPMSQDLEDSFLAIWLFFAGTLEPVLPRALAGTVDCVESNFHRFTLTFRSIQHMLRNTIISTYSSYVGTAYI